MACDFTQSDKNTTTGRAFSIRQQNQWSFTTITILSLVWDYVKVNFDMLLTDVKQVAQLWQRDRAKLDTFRFWTKQQQTMNMNIIFSTTRCVGPGLLSEVWNWSSCFVFIQYSTLCHSTNWLVSASSANTFPVKERQVYRDNIKRFIWKFSHKVTL